MSSKNKSAAPSQRQLRMGEEIRHILCYVLSKNIMYEDTPHQGTITVTEVQMTADLKTASVFIMTLNGDKLDHTVANLNTHMKYYRHEVATTMNLKYMPKLIFKPDLSYAQAERFENLLKSPKVAQDLKKTSLLDSSSSES